MPGPEPEGGSEPTGVQRRAGFEHPRCTCGRGDEALRSRFASLLVAEDRAWSGCARLGVVLDPDAAPATRLRAMHDLEPFAWTEPAGEILLALERLTTATRLGEPTELHGLRGAVLMEVWRRPSPADIGTLALLVQASEGAVRKVVARLEREDLVTRSRDRSDGRSIRVSLTQEGSRLARFYRQHRVRLLARELRQLFPDDVAALVHAARSADWLVDRLIRWPHRRTY